jgi:hypothetical protein
VLVDERVGFDAWGMQGKNFEKLDMGQPQRQHWLINYKRTICFLKKMLYKKKKQNKMYWLKNKSKITFWFKTKFEKC